MKDAELEAIDLAHRAGQARLGILAGSLALIEWGGVNPVQAAATATRWTAQALRYIGGARRKSYRLGVAYYRYVRAVDAGFTVPVPSGPPQEGGTRDIPTAVTLAELRQEFEDILMEIATMDTEPSKSGVGNEDEVFLEDEVRALASEMPDPGVLDEAIQNLMDAVDDSDTPGGTEIPVDDDFDFTPAVLQGDALRDQYEELLQSLVIDFHDARINKVPDDLVGEEVTQWADATHEMSGARGANLVATAGMGAGREVVDSSYNKDRRAIAACRVTTSDEPCALCALLASRGYEYKSEATAAFDPHDGCLCTTSARFTDDPKWLPHNAYLSEMWRKVQNGTVEVSDGYNVGEHKPRVGKDGKKKAPAKTDSDAFRAWRRWFLAEQRKNSAKKV